MAFSFGQPAQQNASAGSQVPTITFGGSGAGGGASSAPKPSFSFGGSSSMPGQGQQQQQQQPGGSSLFGGGQQQQSNTSNISGQQQQPNGGFGSSLFGGQQASQQQQGNSLFGNTNNGSTNAGGSLFGPPQQQQQQQQQGQQPSRPAFSFGNPNSNQAPSANPLTLSQLSTQPQYQLQQSQNQNKPSSFLGASTLGVASGGSGGQGAAGGAATKDGNAQKRLGIPVNDKLEAIRAAWDVRDLQTCRFLCYFYNAIPQQPPGLGDASLANPNFGRRNDAIGPRHDAMWLQTLRENPDRSRLVPVLAIGFPDLKSRIEMQQAETQRQSTKLTDLRKRLDDLNSKHTLSNSVRIAAISRKQTSLHHRLISIARKIHLLIPALRGQSVTLKEEQLKSILQNCELELESLSLTAGSKNSSGQFNYTTRLRSRVNELWALLGNVKAKREAILAHEGGHGKQLEWAVVDESALEDVAKILSSQQLGLDHLSTTLQSDTKALDTVMKGLEGVELTGVK